MNKSVYTSCIQSFGIETGVSGSVLGIYDLTGHDPRVVFNQFHPTGAHYLSGLIYTSVIPLISRNQAPTTGRAVSNHCYSFANRVTGDFSVLVDFDYNACQRNTVGVDYILLSSIDNLSGINTGFYVGLNEANRLFLKTSGEVKTLSRELKGKNFFYLSLSDQRYLNFGVFDIGDNAFYGDSIQLENAVPSARSLYLAGFLNNNNRAYTGFAGNINNVVYYNKPIEPSQIAACADCLFVTGFSNLGTGVRTVTIPVISGYTTGAQYETGVIGYSTVSGQLVKSDGSTVSIYSLSGVTGLTLVNTYTNLLTGSATLSITGDIISGKNYNLTSMGQYTNYNIELKHGVVSGDFVEVYTYNSFNSGVNRVVNGLIWPNETSTVQLIGNGLIETSGVDFTVQTGLITNFDPSQEILRYDLYTGTKIVMPYSGWWERGRIQISGGYFPSTGQFQDVNGTGKLVWNLSGLGISIGNYDIYLNGQKLISGEQYSVIPNINTLHFSGNLLPDFSADAVYHPAGGLPTGVINVHDNELTVFPRENTPNRYLFKATSDRSLFRITGRNEQVWINGVRQTKELDYIKDYDCSLTSGYASFSDYPFNFFNNDPRFFNIGGPADAPKIADLSVTAPEEVGLSYLFSFSVMDDGLCHFIQVDGNDNYGELCGLGVGIYSDSGNNLDDYDVHTFRIASYGDGSLYSTNRVYSNEVSVQVIPFFAPTDLVLSYIDYNTTDAYMYWTNNSTYDYIEIWGATFGDMSDKVLLTTLPGDYTDANIGFEVTNQYGELDNTLYFQVRGYRGSLFGDSNIEAAYWGV